MEQYASEIHLRQPRFTYSVCGQFTENKEFKNKKTKKQEIHNIFIKINWIKLDFNMTWLAEILRIYPSDNVLRDQAFSITKNLKYD